MLQVRLRKSTQYRTRGDWVKHGRSLATYWLRKSTQYCQGKKHIYQNTYIIHVLRIFILLLFGIHSNQFEHAYWCTCTFLSLLYEYIFICLFQSLLTQLSLWVVHAALNRVDGTCVPGTTASEAINKQQRETTHVLGRRWSEFGLSPVAADSAVLRAVALYLQCK